jgi:hypothetical protein
MAFLAPVFAAAFVLFVACDDSAVPEACTNIPAGGCPRSHGVACEDPACEAIYLCRPNNVWEVDQRCPPHDAGPPDAGDIESDAGAPAHDASIDAPPGAYGGPGCEDLEVPDCSLGAALACGADCCGCEDLFVCQNGGWTLWGSCGDAGPHP